MGAVKDGPFDLMDQGCMEFEALKMCFTTAPILQLFDSSLHTVVKTDASDYAIAGVLSQFLNPAVKTSKDSVAFNSRKLTSVEVN